MLTRRLLIAALLLMPALPVVAGGKRVFNTGGVAISGYDPVAYHLQGRPVPGLAALALKWKGATWRFATEENRQAFEMDPWRYAPAYGGFCAGAMAEGRLVGSTPEAFTLHNGRLYLHHSAEAAARWAEDRAGNAARADAHWPGAAKK